MRTWALDGSHAAALPGHALAGMISQLGQPHFDKFLLASLHPVIPAASCAIYRTGHGLAPHLFMSASYGVADTTRACWQAYLSGPQQSDRTLAAAVQPSGATAVCHITAAEVPAEHRARVYEAHGVSERISVVQQDGDSLFAVNFYRHQHQRPFSDGQLADFGAMAPALLALTQKHIAMASHAHSLQDDPVRHWHERLLQADSALTVRERDVCARLLTGMTQDGIAADLGLTLPTVKTYRNRAFARLGIHFRNELFALFLKTH